MTIVEALQQLDTQNDEQWTQAGLPRLEVMQSILGRQLTRQEITDAAPFFTRENPDLTQGQEETVPAEDPEIKLAKAQERLEEARKEVAAANDEADAAIREQEKNAEPPQVQNSKNIRAYLDRQQQNRMERAQKRQELIGSGVDLKKLQEIITKSPIDTALLKKRDTTSPV